MIISPHKISRIFFALTVAILFFISYITYLRLKGLISSSQSVSHTNNVRFELQQVISELRNIESMHRGFIISKDSIFLLPAAGSKLRIDSGLHKLDSLVFDNPTQLKNLFVLHALIKIRFDFLNETPFLDPKKDEKLFFISLNKAKKVMDQINYQIQEMMRHENMLLEKRSAIWIKYESVSPFFLLILTLFSLLLISVSYFIIRNQLIANIRFQKDLENKIAELNRSNKELEQFAYVASHDLQEPLRKIQAFSDKLVMKHADAMDENTRFIISRMNSAAERMQKLINDLLSFSRLVQHVENKKQMVNLNHLITEIVNDLPMVEEGKAIINQKTLPEIIAVEVQMKQLFQNLISNAIKFSKQDIQPVINVYSDVVHGQEIWEIVNKKHMHKFHKITIEDNGIGFDEQYLDKLFVIFQRLHGKMEYEGTGIGLAVCKKIVTYHEGYITAKSSLGNGSRFIIYLPFNPQ